MRYILNSSSAPNLIVAFSNLMAFVPMYTCYKSHDYITTLCISYVFIASFISHLFESHKHGMIGFNTSKDISFILNRFDVMGVFLVIGRFIYLYYLHYGFNMNKLTKNKLLLFLTIFAFGLNFISEHDKSSKTKNFFILAHSIWHIMIFTIINFYFKYLFL